jgi:hypothetical protein
MPLYKCTKCHHEWEGAKKQSLGWSFFKCDICAWCGEPGEILEEQTSLERANFSELLKRMKEEK